MRGANVQDCSVLHVNATQGVEVGPGATIGHNCTVHAAWLAEECLIGNGATVLDGARIGVRAMVAAGALVTPGTEIPDGMLAMGTPAKVRGPLAGTPAEHWVRRNPRGLPETRPAPQDRRDSARARPRSRRRLYTPLKLAARFSLNAATPSA